MTPRCIELVKHFEGFSPVPYLCPAGIKTIGYGHVITSDEDIKIPLSKEEAEIILIIDLLKVEKAITPLITVKIHPFMLDALISFSFNVGIYAFKASTLRRKLNAQEYLEAADEFLKWVFAGGRKLKGLIRRREAERGLYLEGFKLLF